jgi:hypothetical protein
MLEFVNDISYKLVPFPKDVPVIPYSPTVNRVKKFLTGSWEQDVLHVET